MAEEINEEDVCVREQERIQKEKDGNNKPDKTETKENK